MCGARASNGVAIARRLCGAGCLMARNSSVEAMQDFAPLLRKPPADLLVMLPIDEN